MATRGARHVTASCAVPGFAFEAMVHVQETVLELPAVFGCSSAATVDTRPEGRETAISQVAPADVRAPTVAVDPAATEVGTVTDRTESVAEGLVSRGVGGGLGVAGRAAVVVASGIPRS